jgi:hypothetical protein
MRVQNCKSPPVLHKYDALIPSNQQSGRGLQKESLGTLQKAITNIDGASNEPKTERRRKTESPHKHCFQHIKHWHCIDLHSKQPPPICNFLKL